MNYYKQNGIVRIGPYIYTSSLGGILKIDPITGFSEKLDKHTSDIPGIKCTQLSSDNLGRLWVSTLNTGFMGFDNNSWISFNTSNSSLNCNDFSCITNDLNNQIIVGSKVCGIYVFNGISWLHYDSISPGISLGYINDIAIDHMNNLWVASGNGVFKFDGSQWTVFSGFYFQQSKCIVSDKIGTIYFSNSFDRISKYDGNNWTHINLSSIMGLPNGLIHILTLATDDSNHLWVGSESHGLFKWNGVIWTSYIKQTAGLLDSCITCIYCDTNENVWIGSYPDKGLVLYNEALNTFTSYTNSMQLTLPDNNVFSVYAGYAKFPDWQLWVATNSGLSKYDSLQWNSYNITNSGILFNRVSDITVDQSHHIWCAHSKGGVSEFDGSSGWNTYTTFNSGLSNNTAYRIYTDAANKKWIASFFGTIDIFDGVNWIKFNSLNSALPFNTPINDIIEDVANACVWVATNAGLVCFNSSGSSILTMQNSGLPNDTIYTLCIDSTGALWIGTKNGVACFNTTWITYTTQNSGLPDDRIHALCCDPTGNIWIGTYSGLAKFDGLNWITYTHWNSGLPIDEIYNLSCDPHGRIWICAGGFSTYLNGTWLNSMPFASSQKTYHAFPNPFCDKIVIETDFAPEKTIFIEITDISGSIVMHKEMKSGNTGLLRFYWEGLNKNGAFVSPGIYFCNLKSSEISKTIKIVKTH